MIKSQPKSLPLLLKVHLIHAVKIPQSYFKNHTPKSRFILIFCVLYMYCIVYLYIVYCIMQFIQLQCIVYILNILDLIASFRSISFFIIHSLRLSYLDLKLLLSGVFKVPYSPRPGGGQGRVYQVCCWGRISCCEEGKKISWLWGRIYKWKKAKGEAISSSL